MGLKQSQRVQLLIWMLSDILFGCINYLRPGHLNFIAYVLAQATTIGILPCNVIGHTMIIQVCLCFGKVSCLLFMSLPGIKTNMFREPIEHPCNVLLRNVVAFILKTNDFLN